MLKEIIAIGSFAAFIIFTYGVYYNFLQMEPNSCEMTYMFRNPQFKKINVNNNKYFSNYGLYYYYEGEIGIDIKSLNGAPVLFVPGNGGSYRQVRSLASVSLQMSLQQKTKVHLDYFTIDFEEELSAFYGGYLEKQKRYLQLCIRKIVRMYKKPSSETVKLVIIGHSMGGVVAESVLDVDDFVEHILSIIFLSTPLERPVVNFDLKMSKFYENTNGILQEKRNLTGEKDLIVQRGYPNMDENAFNDILLISVGGGVRDLQVPAWLTTSQFSNIHAMTAAIPKVWLSCDHLSIVWCLQLMKQVNRFLYSILESKPENYVVYRQHFGKNIQSAYKHFIGVASGGVQNSSPIDFFDIDNNTIWHIESGERGYKTFKNGIRRTFIQLMPLQGLHDEKMYVEVSEREKIDGWLFGCISFEEKSGKIKCKKLFSLDDYISYLPAKHFRKSYALIDLQQIKHVYSDWTHILIKLPATKRAASFHFDIHKTKDRLVELQAAQWFNFTEESMVSTTPAGAAYTQLIINNISLSYLALELHLKKLECSTPQTDVTIKTSASWASGFDEYHIFSEKDQEKRIAINVPIEIAPIIDNSSNHIYIDIHLDPNCRLVISQKLSLQYTLKRILQRFYAHLPAHLVTIVIVLIAQHCSSAAVPNFENMYKTSFKGLLQLKSMVIVTACHLLQSFPPNDMIPSNTAPFLVTILLHETAIVLSIFIALCFCLLHKSFGCILVLIMPRLSVNRSAVLTSRITFGIIILAICLATCAGLGLLLAFLLYFLWLSKESKATLSLSSTEEAKEGFEPNPVEDQKSFLLHFQLLQLLFIVTGLNGVDVMSWVIKYPNLSSDLQWLSNIITLICWLFLWEIKNLGEVFNKKTISLCLYIIAVYCTLYGQENVYTLNYSIAFVYITLFLMVCVCNLWQFLNCYMKVKTD